MKARPKGRKSALLGGQNKASTGFGKNFGLGKSFAF